MARERAMANAAIRRAIQTFKIAPEQKGKTDMAKRVFAQGSSDQNEN